MNTGKSQGKNGMMTKGRVFISEISELAESYPFKTTKRIRQQPRREHTSVRMLAVAVSMCFSVAQVQATTIASGATVTVPGTQTSPWTLTDVLYVDGTMNIAAAGAVSNTLGSVGYGSGSSGTVTVDGSGSTWTNSTNLDVGDRGTGELTINNGGTVSNQLGSIGNNTGSSGTVTVDGPGSTWVNTSMLYVSYSGTGKLTISDGGTVSSTGGYIGFNSGSSGTVTVDGSGSTWTNSNVLYVGNSGTGKLTISDGGVVRNTTANIGNASGSSGTVKVEGSGSTWVNSSTLNVGYSGIGKLTISDGGVVSNVTGYIANSRGSSGTVTVEGSGSTWNNSSTLYVGNVGTGELTIRDGGTVSNKAGYIGLYGSGSVTVDGSGSTWVNSALYVGAYGTGTLTVSDNAVVSAANGTTVAFGSAATGTLDVTSGGTLKSLALAAGDGTVSVTFDAATLQALADNDAFITGFTAGEFVIDTGGLTIDDSGYTLATDTSVMSGSGALTKTGTGILTLVGDNTYTGGTTITAGTLQLGNGGTTGSITGDVQNDGALVFNRSNTYAFVGNISGTGDVSQIGSGITILSGNNTYSGDTLIAAGTLQAGAMNTLSAASSHTVAGAGTLDLDGFSQTVANLGNAGTVQLSPASSASAVGTILTVAGNYESNGGNLYINTVLGDDTSATDKLVAGTITTGSGGATSIYVTNAGGSGAYTTANGIEVVHVTGSSAGDAFVLGRPVTAGVYEYTLRQGADQNWYLSNYLDQPQQPDPSPEAPQPDPSPGAPHTYNPSVGAYLGNQTAATTLFMHTLYDRQGHANNLVSTGKEPRTAWVRVATRHSSGESVKGLMKTRTDQDLIHLGVDMGEWQVQDGNLHVGVMGAYGKSKTRVTSRNSPSGMQAKGTLDGYSVGVYGTWFADEAQGNGLYVDGWAQYSWFKNKVTSDSQTKGEEKYDSHLWTVSTEAGYGFLLGKTANTEIMLTPQVQLAYNYYDADSHMDRNDNLRVNGDKASGVVTRVGARLYGRSTSVFTARPYAEVNWIYSSAENELSFGRETFRDGVPKNRLEAKLGIQGTIAKNWTLWGQAGVQWGKDSYHRYEGQFGLKYQW